MNILIIGSGGREHALCWAVSQNPKCETLYCAPGSDGISEVAKSIPIEISDPVAISNFCLNISIFSFEVVQISYLDLMLRNVLP